MELTIAVRNVVQSEQIWLPDVKFVRSQLEQLLHAEVRCGVQLLLTAIDKGNRQQ